MKYSSKVRIESKVCPGVVFTIRRLTEGRRIELSNGLGAAHDKITKLKREAIPLLERVAPLLAGLEGKTGGIDNSLDQNPDVLAAADVQEQIQGIEANELTPVYVKTLLHSVEGLELDDMPTTAAEVALEGPPELYQEIVAAVNRELGLTGEQQGNSGSPSTSIAPVDGQMKTTSAVPVNVEATI